MSSDDDRNSVPQNLMAVDATAIQLSPLDFLISSCANTGFYETGAWYSVGVGALPRFANYFPDELYSCCRPVKGKITSSVGYRPNRHRIHYGVDFSAEVGDTVVSSINGTVSKIAYERDGYGLFLFVKNSSGVESRYAHLLKVLVHQGDSISSGQPVALAGNSGLSTGPHLHFELRYNGEIVDASLFFR
ncbi:MAG: M23 family metallopeptidase [Muribaculaceae bacterium]|nr:M23 family metallopeptidase [Muribaculaceae bacterium]